MEGYINDLRTRAQNQLKNYLASYKREENVLSKQYAAELLAAKLLRNHQDTESAMLLAQDMYSDVYLTFLEYPSSQIKPGKPFVMSVPEFLFNKNNVGAQCVVFSHMSNADVEEIISRHWYG